MNNSVNLLEGKVINKILLFALPIFLSSLFQQLYSVVDSLIVGNYVGTQALAAISSTQSLTFLTVGFFIGTFSGVSVVISKYFGSKRYDIVEDAVHTAIIIGLVFGFILTVFGVSFTPFLLRIMKCPPDVIDLAISYMRIYFLGVTSLVMFNTANGILQAVGNSKLPLFYLMISSLLNIILDYIFVAKFGLGIQGAAIATVIAQTVSVILALKHLFTVDAIYNVSISKLKYNKQLTKEMLKLGIPSGIQNSVISIGNIVVQSNINLFGAYAMAGSGVYGRIQGFGFIPITSFSIALTTFVSQNLGAKKYQRVKEGCFASIVIGCCITILIGIFVYFNVHNLIFYFDSNPEVIRIGSLQAKIVSLFFCLVAFSHLSAGILRGSGKAAVPMFIMLGYWCIFRVIYVTITISFIPVIDVVFWAYPITWTLSAVTFGVYLLKANWIHGLD
jgi:putative MATE family efflux protein